MTSYGYAPARKDTVQSFNTIADIPVGFNGIVQLANGDVLSNSTLVQSKTNMPEVALAQYRAIPNSTPRKIAWVGDSTTANMFLITVGGFATTIGGAAGTDYTASVLSAPGQPYYNVTHGNFGSNGNTLSNWLATSTSISDIQAFSPDLIVFGYGGINDVRLGQTTTAQLQVMLNTAITKLQVAFPSIPIIMRMANPLVYDAANTPAYLDAPNSLAKVQNYSDIMMSAVRSLVGKYVGVYVLDVRGGDGQIFPQNCTTLAAKGNYMADALHPAGEGYAAIIREVAVTIGNYGYVRFPNAFLNTLPLVPKFPAAEAYQATTISTTADYLLCPRVLEDPAKYNLIADGIFVAGAAGSYLDFGSNTSSVSNNLRGVVSSTDILLQYGVPGSVIGSQGDAVDNGNAAFLLSGISTGTQGSHIRFLGFSAGYPRIQNTFQNVRIYRARPIAQKNNQDLNFSVIFAQADFTAGTMQQVVKNFGVASVLTGISKTACTTGGTITLNKNGVAFAVLTWANGATVPTYSGVFFTDATRGAYFDEGDIISAVVSSGFSGGTYPKITLSNT